MPLRVLCFRVGERRWALALNQVREVLESPRLLCVPGSRARVAGIMLRVGVVIPVYDPTPGHRPPPYVAVVEWAELLNGLCIADPDTQQALGEEEGEAEPPCRGRVRLRDGTAERLDLEALYRMLQIPT